MSVQPFELGEMLDRVHLAHQRPLRERQDAAATEEIAGGDTVEEPGGAGGREHVARAGREVSGGFGRVATLYWQTAEGEPVTLRSIWPADAVSLLEGGFHFMPAAGPTLFGSASVRMEKDDSVRLHTATDQALYVVLLPRSLSGQVSDLCRSLQLFTAAQQSDEEP